MLESQSFLGDETMFKALMILVGTFLYVVWPIDIVPDLIPVVGQCDDLAILVCGVKAAYAAWTGKDLDTPSVA